MSEKSGIDPDQFWRQVREDAESGDPERFKVLIKGGAVQAGVAFAQAPQPAEPDARASATVFGEAMLQVFEAGRWHMRMGSMLLRTKGRDAKDEACRVRMLEQLMGRCAWEGVGLPRAWKWRLADGTVLPETARMPVSNYSLIANALVGMRQARPLAFENYEQVAALAAAPLPSDFAMDALRLPFDHLFLDFRGHLPCAVTTRDPRQSIAGARLAAAGYIPDGIEHFVLRPRAALVQQVIVPPRSVVQVKAIEEGPVDLSHYRADDLEQIMPLVEHRLMVATIFADAEDFAGAEHPWPAHGRLRVGPHLFCWWQPGDQYVTTVGSINNHEDIPFWNLLARLILFMHSPAVEQHETDRRGHSSFLRTSARDIERTADPTVRVLRVRLPRHVRVPLGSPTPADGHRAPFAYRFDVRGHFKHFRRGRLEGRVIWCPAFVKGPADRPYRPSLRVVQKEEAG